MNRKINEIFYSLQGEGYHTGVAAVFVRFSGCNLQCYFCDTEHKQGTDMTDDEIIAAVMQYPQAPWIILTGGEPSLFIDSAFVKKLKIATNKQIAIETNGTHTLPLELDWVTLSPKTTYAGGGHLPIRLSACDELKVIYTGQSLEGYFDIAAKHYFLQPCFSTNENKRLENQIATVQEILKDPRWQLSVQMHRWLQIQ